MFSQLQRSPERTKEPTNPLAPPTPPSDWQSPEPAPARVEGKVLLFSATPSGKFWPRSVALAWSSDSRRQQTPQAWRAWLLKGWFMNSKLPFCTTGEIQSSYPRPGHEASRDWGLQRGDSGAGLCCRVKGSPLSWSAPHQSGLGFLWPSI